MVLAESTTPEQVGSFHTLEETAQKIKSSRRTVERMIDAGVLRVVRIGKRVYVSDDSLREFLDKAAI